MSLKRKRDDHAVSSNTSTCPPASAATWASTPPAAFTGYPSTSGQQPAGGILPAFSMPTAMQTNNQTTDRLTRLRPPTSTITVVRQENVEDIAGLSTLLSVVRRLRWQHWYHCVLLYGLDCCNSVKILSLIKLITSSILILICCHNCS